MYFGCFGFRGEHGFLNCDDVCTCVVNKHPEPHEFAFDSAHADLQHDDTSLITTAGSLSLCCVCGHPRSVCEFAVVPYVDEVVAVMRVPPPVPHVCLLRECDGVRLTAMPVWRMDEVWWVRGMWVVHVVQVCCLGQLTCYE